MGQGMTTPYHVEVILPDLVTAVIEHQCGQVFVFSMTNQSPEYVEALFYTVHQVQQAWDKRQMYLAVFDFSRNLKLRLTPQFQELALEVATLNRAVTGRSAFVLPELAPYIIRPFWSFIRTELPKAMPQHEFAAFPDGKAAFKWLQSPFG